MTVHGMTAVIFVPGPESPQMSPWMIDSLWETWERLLADSKVCGSSMMTKSGRMLRPSAVAREIPLIRPVIDVVVMAFPAISEPGTVGNTRVSVQRMCVFMPWHSCPAHRLAIPSSAATG